MLYIPTFGRLQACSFYQVPSGEIENDRVQNLIRVFKIRIAFEILFDIRI